ncbi:hypothetical protein [Pedosphaera parvula]|uniref:Uncharacterized protein n=1 Tax=Pedosphaera parvula (strain Ellin514) TaxID=320771 RepID=B9XIF0_PEDPL|nr:hypothetical protein [Pedosphaera parvula]EEF60411.1 conserved hypothetical protein [Pedosphaera parvula Ellin514]
MIKGFCQTLALAFLSLCSLNTQGSDVRLPFDEAKLEFSAPPLEQARWLLRPVAEYGVLGKPLTSLPNPQEDLIGKPMTVDRSQLQSYLSSHKITDAEIGGAITNTLKAKYFVIHDVSAPNYHEKTFPTNINEATWFYNGLTFWGSNHAAHFFVNRLGQSVAPHPLTTPWRATKFETKVLKEKSRGLFVHTELIQPRRTDPQGRPGNDGIAPDPGFTESQLDRLALLYVIASVEHGTWMVPAFHANIDAGYSRRS